MRWMLLVLAPACWSQSLEIAPLPVKQGETLHVRAAAGATSAKLNGRSIALFPDPGGGVLGLMPIPVMEKPGSYTLQIVDGKDSILIEKPVVVANAHYLTQNIVMGKELTQLRLAPGEAETALAFQKLVTPKRYWEEPLKIPLSGCMGSPFGVARLHNGKPTGDYHAGIDQHGASGTPIHAIAAGEVKIVRAWNLRGNTVGIDHGQGLLSMYLHMSKFAVAEGDIVKAGDVIGYVGATGRATGPHLHWSMYIHSFPVNPAQWIKLKACGSK